jgi:hypothetical protein
VEITIKSDSDVEIAMPLLLRAYETSNY